MQKECIICGAIFESKRKDRQYCDDCQKNSGKAKAKLNNAIMRSKYRLGEFNKVKDKVCSYCNKSFKTTDGYRDFCNSECERNYKIKNNLCQYCKKPLYPEIVTIASTVHPECKEAAYKDWAIRKGWQRNCKQCGNEFLAKTKNQVYCSQECKRVFYAKDLLRPT